MNASSFTSWLSLMNFFCQFSLYFHKSLVLKVCIQVSKLVIPASFGQMFGHSEKRDVKHTELVLSYRINLSRLVKRQNHFVSEGLLCLLFLQLIVIINSGLSLKNELAAWNVKRSKRTMNFRLDGHSSAALIVPRSVGMTVREAYFNLPRLTHTTQIQKHILWDCFSLLVWRVKRKYIFFFF